LDRFARECGLQFALELAYDSNGIEGNSLSLKETGLVIEEGISIKGKPLREVFEALNHQKAFLLLEGFVKKKGHFSEKILLDIRRVILSGIDVRYAGRYRDVNVRIPGALKCPPRFEKV
jgi:Fic family protein